MSVARQNSPLLLKEVPPKKFFLGKSPKSWVGGREKHGFSVGWGFPNANTPDRMFPDREMLISLVRGGLNKVGNDMENHYFRLGANLRKKSAKKYFAASLNQ